MLRRIHPPLITRAFVINGAVACILFILASAYFAIFIRYGTNTPFIDEYYDCLYYLHIFNGLDTWTAKLNSIFWQYNEHKQTASKLAYILQYTLLDRIDFFWLSFVGSLQLLLIPYMIWLLIQPRARDSILLLPIPYFFLLNLALWRTSYLAIDTFASIITLALVIAISILVHKNTKWSLVLSLACLYLVTFSYGNGILMPFLASFQIFFSSRNNTEKKIWFAMVAILLILFIAKYEFTNFVVGGMSTKEKIQIMIHSTHLTIIGFFMLIGATPFKDGDPAWLGTVTGIIIFNMASYMLYSLWINDRRRFYPVLTCILFCFSSYALIAIVRIPFSGLQQAYESHYKIYTLFTFAALTLFFATHIKPRWMSVFFITAMLSIAILASIRSFSVMVKSNEDRRLEVTEWALKGTHESLGFSGWPPLTEQLMFMAVREKIYSPFDTTRAALYQAKEITEIKSCLPPTSIQIIPSEIINNPEAIAAGISVNNDSDSFDEIWLCSPQHYYRLIPDMSLSNRIIIEKSKLPADNYLIYFIRKGNIIGHTNESLIISNEITRLRCQPTWGATAHISIQVTKEFCKKVFK